MLPPASDTRLEDTEPHWLDPEELIELIRLGPLVSIDLVIQDPEGRILVGLRSNEPARGAWFVPGGIVVKGESLDQAFRRIAQREVALDAHRKDARFLGVFEHFYDSNFLGREHLGTHYIALGHALTLDASTGIELDGQHRGIRWLTRHEILADPEVHEHTRRYAEVL